MARNRTIHHTAPVDEDVATMSIHARYVWAYLPCHADREGRLRDSAFSLKTAILPADDVDMEAILAELADRKHVVRYEVNGRKYIQIRSFLNYQTPHTREQASTIPPPPIPRLSTGEPDSSTSSGTALVGPRLLGPVAHGAKSVRSGSGSGSDPDRDSPPQGDLVQTGAAGQEPWVLDKRVWGPSRWLLLFGRAWAADRRVIGYGGGTGPTCGKLGDVLERLPVSELLAAQEVAAEMFAAFLADTSPRMVAAKHSFAFFVQDFDGLRAEAINHRGGLKTRSEYPEVE